MTAIKIRLHEKVTTRRQDSDDINWDFRMLWQHDLIIRTDEILISFLLHIFICHQSGDTVLEPAPSQVATINYIN